jgi:two-component system, OmpR family, response regulator MprA
VREFLRVNLSLHISSAYGGAMTAIDGAPRILFAEDDPGVREALARALRFEGYDVQTASDGGEALEFVGENPPDLVVLDVMMPFVDGLSVCRRVREKYRQLPILMLTARHEVSDRVAGLDAGADDYLAKPFALDELLARIRALLRRTMASGNEQSISAVGLFLDPARRVATRDGVDLDLTKTEFDLLDLLMTNAGIVLSRDVLYERIWGFDFETSSKSLDVYIGYLRRKTEENNASRLIHTVRGVGYVLRAS